MNDLFGKVLFLVPTKTTKKVTGILNSLRIVWFALASAALGLEAHFSDLVTVQGDSPRWFLSEPYFLYYLDLNMGLRDIRWFNQCR